MQRYAKATACLYTTLGAQTTQQATDILVKVQHASRVA